ncbi:MAG: dephospho-CoA kinase [Spirochaetales bacterium]
MVIGLSGPYCSGKSEVGRRLVNEYGFSEIDVDRVGHEAVRLKTSEIIATFGGAVRSDSGGINRTALGRIVFADPTRMAQLESLVHPVMVELVRDRVKRSQSDRILINAALLVHMGLDTLCDAVIRVEAPVTVRIWRAKLRDGLTLGDILARIRRQRGLEFSSQRVDTYTMHNAGGRKRLERRLRTLAVTIGFSE